MRDKDANIEDDYKQIAYKLQHDIEMQVWFKNDRDLQLLKEMRMNAIKALDYNNASAKKTLFKMMNDWIDELEEKIKE